MPTLNWIGKDAVIRHHKEVPFRLLEAELSRKRRPTSSRSWQGSSPNPIRLESAIRKNLKGLGYAL